MKLTGDFEKNKRLILDALKNNSDIIERTTDIIGVRRGVIFYLDGLCKTADIAEYVLAPLRKNDLAERIDASAPFTAELIDKVLTESRADGESDVTLIAQRIMEGDACLIVSGESEAVMLDAKGYNTRSIAEPPTSGSLKGPREGFIEDFKQNLLMLRRRIRTPDFKADLLKAGRRSRTNIAVTYIDGVADKDIVEKVKKKISDMDIDGVLDSSYVATFLEDRRGSVFPQIGRSEKPDAVAGKLLEGRIAVIVDGSPMVLTVPFLIIEELFGLDDYYEKPALASISRILRALALAFALLLPGLYVCVQKYNYQVIPTKFLMTVINSTDGIALSPLTEMLVVIFLFDMLQEANVRMPRTAGLALNVVGALVLGDAAIKAGLISAPAVLIGALNGIGLYAAPDELRLFSMLRWIFTLAAGLFGVFGMSLALLFFVTYLVSFDTYGAPYLAPYAPRIPGDLQDGFFKQGLLNMKRRPKAVPNENEIRMGEVKN